MNTKILKEKINIHKHYKNGSRLYEGLKILTPFLFIIAFYLQENGGYLAIIPDFILGYMLWSSLFIARSKVVMCKARRRSLIIAVGWLLFLSMGLSLTSKDRTYFQKSIKDVTRSLDILSPNDKSWDSYRRNNNKWGPRRTNKLDDGNENES